MLTGFFNLQTTTLGTNFAQDETAARESVISLLATWTGLYITLGAGSDNETTYSAQTPPEDITSFYQELSLRNGTVVTEVGWAGVTLRYTIIAHRSRPTLGLVRLDVTGLPDAEVVISDVLDGQGAARVYQESAGVLNATDAADSIFVQLSPLNVPNVTAHQISAFGVIGALANSTQAEALRTVSLPESVASVTGANLTSTSSQSFPITSSNGTISVWKAVGIASTDAFADPRATALNASQSAREQGWDAVVAEHAQAWEEMWDEEGGDIVIHKQTDDATDWQRTTRASLFHLLANSRRADEGPGLGDNSIAPAGECLRKLDSHVIWLTGSFDRPAGLTSDSYAGSIFWDAETWMFPSLSSLFPKFAESILRYRSKLPQQYVDNAAQYNYSGIVYPWVSARYQNCTGIGPCADYEYHLNNDIALSQWQYYQQTGNRTFLETYAWPIMRNVSTFWASKVVQNGTSYSVLK